MTVLRPHFCNCAIHSNMTQITTIKSSKYVLWLLLSKELCFAVRRENGKEVGVEYSACANPTKLARTTLNDTIIPFGFGYYKSY